MSNQMAVASASEEGGSLLSQPWLPCTQHVSQAQSIKQYLTEQSFGPIFRSALAKWTQLGSPYLRALEDLGKRAQCPLLSLDQLCSRQEKSIEESIYQCTFSTNPLHPLKSHRVFISHMAMLCMIETELDCLKRDVQMGENFLYCYSSLSEHLMAFKTARSRCASAPRHLCIGELVWGQAIHVPMQTLWSETISIIHDMDIFSANSVEPITSRPALLVDSGSGPCLPSTQALSVAAPVDSRPKTRGSAASLGEEETETFSTPLASPFSLYKTLDADDEESGYDGEEDEAMFGQDEHNDAIAVDYALPIIEIQRRPAIAQNQDHKVAMLLAVIGTASNESECDHPAEQGSEAMQTSTRHSVSAGASIEKWCRTIDPTMEQGSSGHCSSHASSFQSQLDDGDQYFDARRFSINQCSMTSDDDSIQRLANAQGSIHGSRATVKTQGVLALLEEPVGPKFLDIPSSLLGAAHLPDGLDDKRNHQSINAEQSKLPSTSETLQPPPSCPITSRQRGGSIHSTSSSVGSSHSDRRVKGKHKEWRRMQSHEQYERLRDQRGALRSSIIELEHVIEDISKNGLDSSLLGQRLSNVFSTAQTESRDSNADDNLDSIRIVSHVGANERKRKSKRKLRQEDERNVAIVSEVASITLDILNQTYEGTFWPVEQAYLLHLHDRLASFWWKQQHRIEHMIQAERRMLVRGRIGAPTVGAIAELRIRFQALAARNHKTRNASQQGL